MSAVYAVGDLDTNLFSGGWGGVAGKPVHGTTRDFLYFDSHVKSFKGDTLSTLDF